MNNLSIVLGLIIILIGIASSVIAILEWIRHGPKTREVIIVVIAVILIGGGVLIPSATTITVHHLSNPLGSNSSDPPTATPSPTPIPVKLAPKSITLNKTLTASGSQPVQITIQTIHVRSSNMTFTLTIQNNSGNPLAFMLNTFSLQGPNDSVPTDGTGNCLNADSSISPIDYCGGPDVGKTVDTTIFFSFVPTQHTVYTLTSRINYQLYLSGSSTGGSTSFDSLQLSF